MKLEDFI